MRTHYIFNYLMNIHDVLNNAFYQIAKSHSNQSVNCIFVRFLEKNSWLQVRNRMFLYFKENKHFLPFLKNPTFIWKRVIPEGPVIERKLKNFGHKTQRQRISVEKVFILKSGNLRSRHQKRGLPVFIRKIVFTRRLEMQLENV